MQSVLLSVVGIHSHTLVFVVNPDDESTVFVQL